LWIARGGLHGRVAIPQAPLEPIFLELSGEVLLGDGEDRYGKEFYQPPARISKSG